MSGYGPDVAKARADDLDRAALAWVRGHVGSHVLDLGCGVGGQSQRLVAAGAEVTAIDIENYTEAFADTAAHFIQGDIRDLATLVAGPYDLCVLQRVIHYVPYTDALTLLQTIRAFGVQCLYISATGIETDIGAGYPCATASVVDRYCALAPEVAETFSIHEPVCLYTPTEFAELLTAAGWGIEQLWVSAFGNSKAICT